MYDDSDGLRNLNLRPSKLARLNSILNYQISTVALYFGAFIIPFFNYILLAAALGFSPYFLYILISEKKTSWVTGFLIVVILPVVLLFIFIPLKYLNPIGVYIFLGAFYFYCFLLKNETREWVTAENAKMELEYRRKLKKINEEIFFKYPNK